MLGPLIKEEGYFLFFLPAFFAFFLGAAFFLATFFFFAMKNVG